MQTKVWSLKRKKNKKSLLFDTKICSEEVQFCTDFRNVSFEKFGWVSVEQFTQKNDSTHSSVSWVKFFLLNAVR